MKKRNIILGSYHTAAHGWTLTGWSLTPAAEKTNYVDKVGGDGSWDLSTTLTDGIPTFSDRELTATFENSEGTRDNRNAEISRMTNLLHGMRVEIEIPDHSGYHLIGKVYVAKEYSDEAHAAITVTAQCEPWLYANTETTVILTAKTTAQIASLVNNGRRATVPTLTVTGGTVLVKYEGGNFSMATGSYQWPDLLLTTGVHDITYSGSGTLTVTYREAVLE